MVDLKALKISRKFDEDREDKKWTMRRIEDSVGVILDIVKINFFIKDDTQKVFIGFSDGTAISTASTPIRDQLEHVLQSVSHDGPYLDEPVTVVLRRQKSKITGREYYILE